jgi:uncharacterized protein YbjT (DUF2867 family)
MRIASLKGSHRDLLLLLSFRRKSKSPSDAFQPPNGGSSPFAKGEESALLIPSIGVYADMTAPDTPLPMVATADIAQVIARELRTPTVLGKHVLHLRAPRLYTMRESAALLGAAIGKPDLAYVQSNPHEGKAALMEHGFSASTASALEEMSVAFSCGLLNGEYEKGPTEIMPTTLENFAATVFKPAYEASAG